MPGLRNYGDEALNPVPTLLDPTIDADEITFIQSGSGAIETDLQTRGRLVYYPNDYSTLAQAITAASGKTLDLLAGTYNFDPSGGITAISGKLRGAGKGLTIINITGNGDVFQRGPYSVFEDLTIQMNGATYSGHAMRFAGGDSNQVDRNIEVKNVANGKQAGLFEADGGNEFCSIGSTYYTLTAAGSGAAIKFGADTAASARTFIGAQGAGCTVFDFGGSNDTFVFGGYTSDVLFSSSSASKVLMSSVRVASFATTTIKGSGHKVKGCVFAMPVILDVGTASIDFDSEVPSFDITDNGTGNLIRVPLKTYTPTWTGSISDPAIGNGTKIGDYSVNGRTVHANISVTMGSTTTFGSGVFRFGLPFAAAVIAGGVWVGSVRGFDSGTANKVGTCLVGSGLNYLEAYFEATANAATSAIPFTWAVNDRIDLAITFDKA